MLDDGIRIVEEEYRSLETINHELEGCRFTINRLRIRINYSKRLIKISDSNTQTEILKEQIKRDKRNIKVLKQVVKDINLEAAPLRLAKALGCGGR